MHLALLPQCSDVLLRSSSESSHLYFFAKDFLCPSFEGKALAIDVFPKLKHNFNGTCMPDTAYVGSQIHEHRLSSPLGPPSILGLVGLDD